MNKIIAAVTSAAVVSCLGLTACGGTSHPAAAKPKPTVSDPASDITAQCKTGEEGWIDTSQGITVNPNFVPGITAQSAYVQDGVNEMPAYQVTIINNASKGSFKITGWTATFGNGVTGQSLGTDIETSSNIPSQSLAAGYRLSTVIADIDGNQEFTNASGPQAWEAVNDDVPAGASSCTVAVTP